MVWVDRSRWVQSEANQGWSIAVGKLGYTRSGFLYSGFGGAWMLVWSVTQALAGAIDRGDPMGVQRVLGKPGMERG